MNLVYKHEKKLFFISAVISTVFWLALLVGTFGILLIYLLFGYLFFLFAHSAFITYLKGTGVKITDQQYPDIYQKLVSNCKKVGIEEIPEAYLLRTDFFNALATRFRGRHFVVLFTDVVDALEDHPGALDFYIGHELGHIHRKHLLWRTFLMPASILPLLGTALRRAEEYTCDRYGVACCESAEDINAALAAIAAGNSRWKTINTSAHLDQVALTNGFWMSFHELNSDYPWLTKRMGTSLALSRGEEISHPRRHPFAWFLSLFIPRSGAGGAASIMVTVAIIGILAAIALPAYQDYTERTRLALAYSEAEVIKRQVTSYVTEKQAWPESLQDLGYDTENLNFPENKFDIGIYENGLIGVKVGTDRDGNEKYVVLEPVVEEGNLRWVCYGQAVKASVLPNECR